MRITWKKEQRETGLRGVCQGERGCDIRIDGHNVGSVRPLYRGFSREKVGYYWYARDDVRGIAFRNTSSEGITYSTLECAKVDCEEYIRRQLEKK